MSWGEQLPWYFQSFTQGQAQQERWDYEIQHVLEVPPWALHRVVLVCAFQACSFLSKFVKTWGAARAPHSSAQPVSYITSPNPVTFWQCLDWCLGQRLSCSLVCFKNELLQSNVEHWWWGCTGKPMLALAAHHIYIHIYIYVTWLFIRPMY